MRTVLVTGFGPFLGVIDNPASRLARAVAGREARGVHVEALGDLPVSYQRGPALTIARALELDPIAVLGIGVARRAVEARVEDLGRNRLDPALADVDGIGLACLDEATTFDHTVSLSRRSAGLAEALGVAVNPTHDAGGYVCNAWAYQVQRALGDRLDVCFLHVPEDGFPAPRLLLAIGAVWGKDR